MEEQSGWITDIFKRHLEHKGFDSDCSYCKYYREDRYKDLTAEKINSYIGDIMYNTKGVRVPSGIGIMDQLSHNYKRYTLMGESGNQTVTVVHNTMFDRPLSTIDKMRPAQMVYNILMSELDRVVDGANK